MGLSRADSSSCPSCTAWGELLILPFQQDFVCFSCCFIKKKTQTNHYWKKNYFNIHWNIFHRTGQQGSASLLNLGAVGACLCIHTCVHSWVQSFRNECSSCIPWIFPSSQIEENLPKIWHPEFVTVCFFVLICSYPLRNEVIYLICPAASHSCLWMAGTRLGVWIAWLRVVWKDVFTCTLVSKQSSWLWNPISKALE